MVRFNPSGAAESAGEDSRDRLLAHINLESEVAQRILEEGYCVLPSVLSAEEADEEYDRMWGFISKIKPDIRRNSSQTWTKPLSNEKADPWPCAQRDMFQLHQAGWVFNDLREKVADRVFEPLYGTKALHVSKDGFTLQRPTHQELGRSPNDHYDQGSNFVGLQCIQGSVALTDQEYEDGCFSCWPRSHIHHEYLTQSNERDFQILSAKQKSYLISQGIHQLRVPVKKGDVILWRSDLAHCGAPPLGARENFRAVVYICCLPAVMTPLHVYKDKRVAFQQLQTGCHWPNREEWFKPRRQNKESKIKPYFDIALKQRPQLTTRLEQLYGLTPYPEEELQAVSKVVVQDSNIACSVTTTGSETFISATQSSKVSTSSGAGGGLMPRSVSDKEDNCASSQEANLTTFKENIHKPNKKLETPPRNQSKTTAKKSKRKGKGKQQQVKS